MTCHKVKQRALSHIHVAIDHFPQPSGLHISSNDYTYIFLIFASRHPFRRVTLYSLARRESDSECARRVSFWNRGSGRDKNPSPVARPCASRALALDIDCAIDVGAQLGGLQGACRRWRHASRPQPRDQGICRRPHGRLVAEREGARAEERGKRGV